MSSRPLIGVTGSRFAGNQIVDNLNALAKSPIDVFYADYSQAVVEAGGLPVHLPIDADPAGLVARLDGLLLTGGWDIDPARYGEVAEPQVQMSAPERDAFELALLDAAHAAATPTAGVCRGLQIINVHAGGTLHQHVPSHTYTDPVDETHEVAFADGSTLADLYGSSRAVNSLHHQTVAHLGHSFRATGTTAGGDVEAIEHDSLPVLAVQWHPEMLPTRATDPLFSWLVGAASEPLRR